MSDGELRSFPAMVFVDFEEPTVQRSWVGFNPQARGHQRWAAVHRVMLQMVAFAFAGAGAVTGIWFGRIDAAFGGFALGILISSLSEFIWKRMRYCRHCGATVSHPMPRTNCYRCPACLRLVDAEDFFRTLGEPYDPRSPNKERWEDPYCRFVAVLLNLIFAGAAKRIFMVNLGERIGLGVYEETHGGQPDYEVQDPPTHCFAPARELLEIMSHATPDARGGLTGELNANFGQRLMKLQIRIKADAVAISVVEETRMCA